MAKGPSSPSQVSKANEKTDATTSSCKEKRVIVIDPGHGGTKNLPGSSCNNATSHTGVLEKTLTLKYAQKLKEHLDSDACQKIFQGKGFTDVKVILTRTIDENVAAVDRVKVATDNKADILLSIHFNAGDGKARGMETYYRVASNGAQSNEGEDKALAGKVLDAALQAMKEIDANAKSRGVKPDTETKVKSVAVLRDPGIGLSGKMCRSTLIEVEFIDVPSVDTLLVSGPQASLNCSSVMSAVAKALANAL